MILLEHNGYYDIKLKKYRTDANAVFKKEISHSRIKFNFMTQSPNIISFSLGPKTQIYIFKQFVRSNN